MIWMRTASLYNFRKIYATITTLDEDAKYQVEIRNNYDQSLYGGNKAFMITNYNKISGGKNYFLAVCFIFFGCFLILLSGIYSLGLVAALKTSNRPNDDDL